MRTTFLLRILSVISLIGLVFFIGCEEDQTPTTVIQGLQLEASHPGKLNAFPILGYMQSGGKLPPQIDGFKTDLIWDAAEPYEIALSPDAQGYAPKVTLRALYDNWYLYILTEWEDKTQDVTPNFWWYGNPGGITEIGVFDTTYTVWVTADSFYKPQRHPVKRPFTAPRWSRWSTAFPAIIKTTTYQASVNIALDKVRTKTWDTTFVGYDTLKFSGAEDGFSFLWNVNVGNFLNCSNLCHGGSRMSTDLNESADVWSWSAYRTNFKKVTDDLALTSTGFTGDSGDSCFVDNLDVAKNLPAFAFKDHPFRNTDVLYDTMAVTYFGTLDWASGNYIPGYKIKNPSLSRADVRAVGTYEDNKWILEVRRKLQTVDIARSRNTDDIQFNPDSDADVSFHLALYNNSRGKNHAFTSTVQVMHFVQLLK